LSPSLNLSPNLDYLFVHSKGIPAAAIHSQLPFPQIEKRLQDLESGKYKILVHVNMLTEGNSFVFFNPHYLCCEGLMVVKFKSN
jgi:hypothetical protein